MASDWKRLHPASLVVNLVPRAWRVARGMWPFLLAFAIGTRTDGAGLFDVLLLLLFFGGAVGSTIVHWATLRYRVESGRLEIESGLFARQTRTIDAARVQNVERVQNIFHRLSGLVEVRVETASGKEVEGLLSALSVADADLLVAALSGAQRAVEPIDDVPPLVALGPTDLLMYGATGLRGAQAALGLSLAFELLQSFATNGKAIHPKLFVAVIPVVVVGAWLAGVVTAGLTHWGYRVARLADDRWSAQGGLLTRRKVEWRASKVQLIGLDETWPRRMSGFGTVRVETAASTLGEGGTRVAEAVIPVVPAERFAEVIGAISGIGVDVAAIAWQAPHPANGARMALLGAVRASVIALPIALLLRWWGLLALALIPLGALGGWFAAATYGWALTDEVLVVRGGLWNRATTVLPRAKVQAVRFVQPLWWRRFGVAGVVVDAAGAQIRVPPLDEADARGLMDALLAGVYAFERPSRASDTGE